VSSPTPIVHKILYGAVPPETVMAAKPSAPPQEASIANVSIFIESGAPIIASNMIVQVVTVSKAIISYSPAARLENLLIILVS